MGFFNYVLKSMGVNANEKQTLKTTEKINTKTPQKTFLKDKKPAKKGANKIAIFKPKNLSDLKEIVCFMASGQQTVLNFKGVDKQVFQRVLDFIAGAVLALGGKVENLGNGMVLFAPKNTQILNKGNNYEN